MQLSLKQFGRKEKEVEEIKPTYNLAREIETVKRITKEWNIHNMDFEKFLDICLAVLENREEDYLRLVKDLKKEVLRKYTLIFGILMKYYYLDCQFGDILGKFYMENFPKGMNGEFYTPYTLAYMMAQMLDPKPDETCIDPTVGSGVMLLAIRQVVYEKYGVREGSKIGKFLYGTDISSIAVKMTKIQLYLTDYIYMSNLLITKVGELIENAKSK